MAINFKGAYVLNVNYPDKYVKKVNKPEQGTIAKTGTFTAFEPMYDGRKEAVKGNVLVLNGKEAEDYKAMQFANYGVIKQEPLCDKLNKAYAANALYMNIPEDMMK